MGRTATSTDSAMPRYRRRVPSSMIWGIAPMTVRHALLLPALAALALGGSGVARAQDEDPTRRDSFAIGSQGGALCEVRATVRDSVIAGMFDRAWMILCRDASQPVGTVRLLRATPDQARARIERSEERRVGNACVSTGR